MSKVSIENKEDNYNNFVMVEDYLVVTRTNCKIDILTNVCPEDILLLLLPLLSGSEPVLDKRIKDIYSTCN